MLDVLMTVLTFFIIISMTLTGQQIPSLTLPLGGEASEPDPSDVESKPLIIGLNQDGQLLLEMQPVSQSEMAIEIQSYLLKNPEGMVILKADQALPYQDVLDVLRTLRDIGGDRVGLATQPN
jgi:biopolymer transport protein ExbD